jgi:hypothetical protein
VSLPLAEEIQRQRERSAVMSQTLKDKAVRRHQEAQLPSDEQRSVHTSPFAETTMPNDLAPALQQQAIHAEPAQSSRRISVRISPSPEVRAIQEGVDDAHAEADAIALMLTCCLMLLAAGVIGFAMGHWLR